jgi:hypothetical protein
MCNFVSWIEYEGEVYYLTDSDLRTRKGRELIKYCQNDDDLKGHGAIERYFELEGKGVHKECEDFSSPDHFPKEIVRDIKRGKFSMIGVCPDILNEEAWKKFKEIERSEWKNYKEVQKSAWKNYKEVQKSELKKYKEIKQFAWKKYKEIVQTAFWEIAILPENRREEWR